MRIISGDVFCPYSPPASSISVSEMSTLWMVCASLKKDTFDDNQVGGQFCHQDKPYQTCAHDERVWLYPAMEVPSVSALSISLPLMVAELKVPE